MAAPWLFRPHDYDAAAADDDGNDDNGDDDDGDELHNES